MKIIAEDAPPLRAVSSRTWIKQTDYLKLEFWPSLCAFAAQRADLLTILELLSIDAWSRAATVQMVGKILERAVLDYAERLAVHE